MVSGDQKDQAMYGLLYLLRALLHVFLAPVFPIPEVVGFPGSHVDVVGDGRWPVLLSVV